MIIDPALHVPLLITAGSGALGLLLMLTPARRRFRNGYAVIQPGAGTYLRRLSGLALVALSVFVAVWRVWPVLRPASGLPPVGEWTPASSADGQLQLRLPTPADGEDAQPPPGFQSGWISPDGATVFGLVQAPAGPGIGLMTPAAVLKAMLAAPAFSGGGWTRDQARVFFQQPVVTSEVAGLRVGIDLPPGHRFFSQQYLHGGSSYWVVMFGPRRLFDDGTAKTFFDSLSFRASGTVTPAAQPSRQAHPGAPASTNPGNPPTRRFETKPGVRRLGD